MIAFTGDLITLFPDELDSMVPILSSLIATDGVLSVLGNHDYSIYSHTDPETKETKLQELIGREQALGWNLLLDESRLIRRGIDSIGII